MKREHEWMRFLNFTESNETDPYPLSDQVACFLAEEDIEMLEEVSDALDGFEHADEGRRSTSKCFSETRSESTS